MRPKEDTRSIWRGLLLVIVLVTVAAGVRVWPLHVLGSRLVYVTYYPAVIIAALYGGLSLGLLATIFLFLMTLFLWPLFLGQPVIKEFSDWLGMGVFLVNCMMISGVAEAMRRSRVREKKAMLDLEGRNTELQAARDNLEEEVKKRTAALADANASLEKELVERKRAEGALQEAKEHLEIGIQERTRDLERANRSLQEEVAERQRAEESVKIQRQRLYDILETMPVMVSLLTPDHHVAFANRSFREKFGQDNGLRCFEYCFGLKQPCEFCETYKVLETGNPHDWEVTTPDGSIIAVYDFPFEDTDGSPLILEIDIDITEQRRAEELVKAERQRFYDVLETLPAYLVLLTPGYYVPFANRFFRERFGEAHGKRCFEYLFNRTEPCEICETYTVLKTRAPHNWEWTGPDGRSYDVHDFPFTDVDGSKVILEVGIDVTERKKAEESLKQTLAELTRSNADLEQFAYVASHDLQEPLRNVASCMQMLEKTCKNKLGPEADQLTNYAVDAVTRMKSLIQGLLSYSRISTTGKPLSRIDSEEVLRQTFPNLRSIITETGAVISNDPLPTVTADPTQLLQVFQNIIGNSLKFRGEEPPRVHVSAVKDGNEWVFSVKDNGIGIESRHLDRIFVIFQRLNKRTRYSTGTGIGLAIVKKIVDRHRGRIWVESEPGKGTTFNFTIPDMENEA
jgi:signal transduction histidine kinase/Skp family chaperone for outer membrane proteins